MNISGEYDSLEVKRTYIENSHCYDIEIPTNLYLHEFICDTKRAIKYNYLNKVAVLDSSDPDNKSYTYKELFDYCITIADWLFHLLDSNLESIANNNIAAIYTTNCIEYPIIIYSMGYLGISTTTINPLYTSSDLSHQLIDSKANIIFTTKQLLNTVKQTVKSIDGSNNKMLYIL
jgi:acyl-CoA synthetase (AMP-forming)/AMP-acid ligase II